MRNTVTMSNYIPLQNNLNFPIARDYQAFQQWEEKGLTHFHQIINERFNKLKTFNEIKTELR